MRTQNFIQQKYADLETRKIVFRVLISLIIFLFIFYSYFVGSIIFNIMAHNSLEINMAEISNDLSQTELEYMTLSNSINAQFGKDNGFVEAKGVIFAQKDSARVALR